MDTHEDILDRIGLTPREYAWLHIHVEPVARNPSGRALATVWMQAAYEPGAPGTLLILDATVDAKGGAEQSRFPLPSLRHGQALKWLLPLQLPSSVERLVLVVQSSLAKSAERVRPAWKLFDTFEIPKESEMKTYNDDSAGIGVGGLFLANALTLPLGAIVIPRGGASVGGGLAESTRATVHKARTLTAGFVAKVVAGDPERITTVAWTRIWRPGQPRPPVAAPVLVLQPIAAKTNDPSSRRVCSGCNFSGRRVDFGTDRYCPNCGHEWD